MLVTFILMQMSKKLLDANLTKMCTNNVARKFDVVVDVVVAVDVVVVSLPVYTKEKSKD